MKKALSLIFSLVLCLNMCACGIKGVEFNQQAETTAITPQTVVLTTENFYQYFDVEYSIYCSESDSVFRNGQLEGFIETATATVEIDPKFVGTWSDFTATISWEVHEYRYGFWPKYLTEDTITQPDEDDGEPVERIVCSEKYKSEEIPYYYFLPGNSYDLDPDMSTPTVENVSGIIVVEGIEN